MPLNRRTTPRLFQNLLMWAACVGAVLAPTLSHAEPLAPPSEESKLMGWAFVFENDFLGTKKAEDRWFTNGLQLTGAYQRGREPGLLKPTLAWGRWMVPQDCEGDACGLTLSTSLGQNIYTPRQVDVAAPQLRDRPWAGWLYGGISLTHFSGNRQQIVGLKAGPTGPASLAEYTQKFVHCCISSSSKPLGWDNQLRPRLGVQLSYLSTHYFLNDSPVGLQASWGGLLGNVRTLGRVAVAATWSAAGGQQPRPQSGGLDEGEFFTPDFSAQRGDGTFMGSLRRTVFYAHLQFSAVAYNALLEGRTYAGRSQIKREEAVGTSTVGFAMPIGERGQHKLGLAWKRRSPEFKVPGDANNDLYQSWGVLTYSHDL